MSELEAADRHIARLEEKVLKLKQAKRDLKQLKAEKQALRKSPERKVGQVFLAPYRLPQKLIREMRKQFGGPILPKDPVLSPNEYQEWLEKRRPSEQDLVAARDEARAFAYRPLISIITPVFNTPALWLDKSVESVLSQVYENWELILIDDGSTHPETVELVATNRGCVIRELLSPSAKRPAAFRPPPIPVWSGPGRLGQLARSRRCARTGCALRGGQIAAGSSRMPISSSPTKTRSPRKDWTRHIFKPDWSPDFFLSYNYLCHFTMIRRELVERRAASARSLMAHRITIFFFA